MTGPESRSWQQAGVEGAMRHLLRPQLRGLPLRGPSLHYLRGLVALTGHLMPSPAVGALRDTLHAPVVADVGGLRVAGEWAIAPDAATDPRDGVVLYLHGGGYVLGSPRSVRPTSAVLSHHARVPVFAAGYRRAPEHTHPSAFEDVVAAHRFLLDQGIAPDRVVLAGDSAGAHLALSLALRLAETDEPAPAGVLLFSPVLDPLGGRPSTADPLVSPQFACRATSAVLGDTSPDDPSVAVLSTPRETLSRLTAVHTSVGATEHFRADSERLHELLTLAGVPQELRVRPHGLHSDVMFGRFVPEAHLALSEGAHFVRERLRTSAAASHPTPTTEESR